MDTVESGHSSATATGTRPSLFGSSQPNAASARSAEPISILSSLDKNAGRKPIRSSTGLPTWFTIAAGSLLGITIAAAIVFSLTRDSGLTPPPRPLPVTRADPPAQAPAPVMTATAPPATNVASSAANAGATIENAPPAAIGAAPAQAAAGSPAAAPAQSVAPSAPPAALPAATPAPGNAMPAIAETAPATDRTESRAHQSHASKSAKVAAKESKPDSNPPAPTNDRDASLLAALVAYGEGKPASEISAAGSGQPATARSAKDGPTLAQSGEMSPKRDVVTRTGAESTAELVRRCRALGAVEGLLCRMRVCSNLWGKDPACPQSAAPSMDRTNP